MAGAQAARYGLQFAVLPVLARLLGPSAYGLVGLAMPFILLANLVADMGLGNALVRTRDPNQVLESTVFWMCEAACAGLVLIICLFAWPASKLFSAPGLPAVLIALSPIQLLGGALSVPNARIMRERRFAVFAAADTVAGLLAAGGAIASAAAGWGVWSLVVQQLVLWSVKTAWLFVASGFRPRLAFDFQAARPHLAYGVHAAAANVTDFLAKSAPALIVGGCLGVEAVGHYGMAYQLIRIPDSLVTGPVFLAIFAAVSQSSHDLAAARRLTLRALRGIAAGIGPMFFGLAATADLAIRLFLGHKWLGSIDILILLTPAGLLICFYSIVVAALLGLGRSADQFHLTLWTGILTNAGVFLGARFGPAGAAAGFSAGAVLIAPAYVWILARALGRPPMVVAVESAPPVAASVVMTAAVVIVRTLVTAWPDWAQLALSIGVGALAFGAALAVLCGRTLLGDLREVLPGRRLAT